MDIFRNIPPVGVVARIFGLLFALFASIFAVDVFTEDLGFWKTVAALFIHLLPSFFILLIIFISWRYEFIGAFIFILLGTLYIFTRQADPVAYLLISGPLLLIGFLFLLSWIKSRHEKSEYDMKG